MCRVHLEFVQMIWKVSWQSKKCPDNLENVSGWYGKCPEDLKSVKMISKVSRQSKKCPDNLENVSGWSKKSLNDLEVCPDNLEIFRMILKVSG